MPSTAAKYSTMMARSIGDKVKSLEAALDTIGRLVMEDAGEQAFPLKNQLAHEKGGLGMLALDLLAHFFQGVQGVDIDGGQRFGVEPKLVRQLNVLFELAPKIILQVFDLLGSLEVFPVHHADGDEDEVLEVAGEHAVDVEKGVDAQAAEIADEHDRRRTRRGMGTEPATRESRGRDLQHRPTDLPRSACARGGGRIGGQLRSRSAGSSRGPDDCTKAGVTALARHGRAVGGRSGSAREDTCAHGRCHPPGCRGGGMTPEAPVSP